MLGNIRVLEVLCFENVSVVLQPQNAACENITCIQ